MLELEAQENQIPSIGESEVFLRKVEGSDIPCLVRIAS
jgi:hypothetical protein